MEQVIRKKSASLITSKLSVLCLCGIFGAAVLKIHVRVRSTMIGYEIGKLKNAESDLLEQRSLLRMQLAQLTNKRHLQLLTETESGHSKGNVAAIETNSTSLHY